MRITTDFEPMPVDDQDVFLEHRDSFSKALNNQVRELFEALNQLPVIGDKFYLNIPGTSEEVFRAVLVERNFDFIESDARGVHLIFERELSEI
ncbi:MAG: hypothetical protein AAF039_09835 [Bacteroidota bacterium]